MRLAIVKEWSRDTFQYYVTSNRDTTHDNVLSQYKLQLNTKPTIAQRSSSNPANATTRLVTILNPEFLLLTSTEVELQFAHGWLPTRPSIQS